jgi:adenylylsulfate kinase
METHQGAGFVVWITGMNRAGKSTLAKQVSDRITASGRAVELLDEDGQAKLLLEGLGTSIDDRSRAVARLGFVARAVAKGGGIAVVAALSPSREARDQVRKDARRFLEVFADCSMEKLQQRDAQGVYKRAFAGELKDVPGVDVPYEPPTRPEVVIHTDQVSVDEARTRIFQGLVDAKLIGPAEFARLTGGLKPSRAKPSRAKPARAARGGGRKKLDAKAADRKAPRKVAARAARAERKRR